jgi:hypothetical protein
MLKILRKNFPNVNDTKNISSNFILFVSPAVHSNAN